MTSPGLACQTRRLFTALAVLLTMQAGPVVADTVRLSWDGNTESNLAGYVLVRGAASRVYTASVTLPASARTHEFTGLPDGTYYFAIRAFDTAGAQSAYSNEVRVVVGTDSQSPTASEPIVTSLTPVSGSTDGDTLVTITGYDFRTGLVVEFGGEEATITKQTGTSITVRTPPGDEGRVSLTVTNRDGGTTEMASAFTYVAPVVPVSRPTIAAVSPASGPTQGATEVTVTGSGFQSGATVLFGGVEGTVTSESATMMRALTPSAVAGSVAVAVVNPDMGTATRAGAFTYVAPSRAEPGPTVSGLAPTQGLVGGGTTVTITGTNFKLGVVVRFGAFNARLVSVASTQVVVWTPPQTEGVVPLTVINSDGYGTQVPAAFTYRAPAPTISSNSPTRGPAGGNTDVTIIGANFKAGAAVAVGSRLATVISATSSRIIARLPAHSPAVLGLTVTNPDGQAVSRPNAYTYVSGGPAVSRILPGVGPMAGGNTISILGQGFLNSVVAFGGVNGSVVSRTSQMLTVKAPSRGSGVVDLLVTNSDGLSTTVPLAYTYLDPNAPFERYFAEGASGGFFQTRFALANPHEDALPVTATFTDTQGIPTTMTLTLPARSRATIDESNRPTLASEAFATKFEAPRAIAVERTMTWAAGGPAYGAHSENGVPAPRTSWVLAEGATIGGFNTFYLLQNPTDWSADVKVQYLLSTGQQIEKVHTVGPLSRTNIWVNKEDPALAAAEMSATLTSVNDVPVVVERSMYRNNGGELFSAGHNSAAVDAPAMRWFLAEGATGGTFDEFVLIANPNAEAASLRVSYLRAGKSPVVKKYVAAPKSRLTIWVDQEAPELASAEVSIVVESLTPTPVVVERSMWWRAAPGGDWIESHNNRAVTTTAARWLVADGESGGPGDASTYVLVANTGTFGTKVNFTLLSESGAVRTVQDTVLANSRYSMDIAGTFPEARGQRTSILVEAVTPSAALVVERASYSSTPATPWAAGTSSLAMPLP